MAVKIIKRQLDILSLPNEEHNIPSNSYTLYLYREPEVQEQLKFRKIIEGTYTVRKHDSKKSVIGTK